MGRIRAVTATAALTILLLGGCSLIGDGQKVWGILQAEAAQQEVLATALHELRSLDGVDTATSRFLADGPHGDEADLHVVATADASVAELVTMAQTARAAFASPELHTTVTKLSLTVGESSVLRTEAFLPSATVLAAEVEHWRAAEAAIGAELSVLLSGDGGSSVMREIIPAAEPGEDAAFTEGFLDGGSELLALPDGWDGRTFWVLPGMTATPDLPPAEVLALLTSIRTEFPLSNPRTQSEGAMIWWQGEERGPTLLYVQNELRESDWPAVIALAHKLIAADIPRSSFVYQVQTNDEFRQYRFYLDKCANELTVGPDDRALVDALAAAGTAVPETGGPGDCAP